MKCGRPLTIFRRLQGIVLGSICFRLNWEDEAGRAASAIKLAHGTLELHSSPNQIQFARIPQKDADNYLLP